MDSFIPSRWLLDLMGEASQALVDLTDVTGIVSLITVDFTESKDIDESEIPADTATFAAKTSGTSPNYVLVPEIGGRALVWPDPAGGWDFTSLQASPSGYAYGYRVDATGGGFVGAKKFPTAVAIAAIGVHVLIGEIALPVDASDVFDA